MLVVHVFESLYVHLFRYENSLPLRESFRLDNEVRAGIVLLEGLEIFKLVGKQPGLGEKFVVRIELLLHLVEVPGQIIFSRNLVHSWEVIYFLKWLHLFPLLQTGSYVGPDDVPFDICVPGIAAAQLPAEHLLSDFLNDVVLSVEYIKNYSWWFDFLLLYLLLLLLRFLLFQRLLWRIQFC